MFFSYWSLIMILQKANKEGRRLVSSTLLSIVSVNNRVQRFSAYYRRKQQILRSVAKAHTCDAAG